MLGNWINQTTTTTGTGALTLAAVSGYPPASSQFATNERFQYAILDDATGAPLERGIGYLDGSGDLVREKPLASMVSGTYSGANVSAVTLAAGTKRVIVSAAAHSSISTAPGVWGSTYKAYGDAGSVAASSTMPLVADRAYAVPFRAGVDADVDGIVVSVTAAAGSGLRIKAAIFSYGIDGLPGVMLAESSAVLADTTGRKGLALTRFRPPPAFFACLLSDGAPTLMSYSTAMSLRDAMGFDSVLAPISYIHHTGASGLTFPAIWTPVANLSNISRPAMAVRCVI